MGSVKGQKGGIATGGGDEFSSQTQGKQERIKSYSLSLASYIPPKDREKHKSSAQVPKSDDKEEGKKSKI